MFPKIFSSAGLGFLSTYGFIKIIQQIKYEPIKCEPIKYHESKIYANINNVIGIAHRSPNISRIPPIQIWEMYHKIPNSKSLVLYNWDTCYPEYKSSLATLGVYNFNEIFPKIKEPRIQEDIFYILRDLYDEFDRPIHSPYSSWNTKEDIKRCIREVYNVVKKDDTIKSEYNRIIKDR